MHRVDLGLGYEPADWPSTYVREELVLQEMRWNARRPMGMTGLPPGRCRPRRPTGWPGCWTGPSIDGLEPAGIS